MPVVNFLTPNDSLFGSNERNAAFTCAHIIFCTFNVLNVMYIVLYEGYVHGHLKHNTLLKVALLGCFTQVFSCFSSIHRYNINDEYGFYGKFGTVTGLLAFFFMNVGYLFIWFHKNYQRFLSIGILFWAVVVLGCAYFTLKDWDEIHFDIFRVFIAVSILYQVIAITLAMVAHKRGDIHISKSILSHAKMNKLFLVSIFLDALGLIFNGVAKMPMVSYPATGLTFSVFVILGGYVGRMDYMTGSEEEGGGTDGETNPLAGDGSSPIYNAVNV